MASSGEESGQTRWQKIDELCDRYEAEKQDGKNPQLSEFLQEAASPEEREQILRELLQLDLELGAELGETTPLEKYLEQLPEDDQLIRTSYERHQTRSHRRGSTSSSTAEPQLTPGQEFGSYTIENKIGAGGMGYVYHARHVTMDRDVALKVLTPKLMDSPDAVARFHREIKAAAKLSHPNIVTAHDAGEQDGLHFLVMEFVDGRDLSSYVKAKGPLSLKQAIKCTIQAAKGLAYAHDQNIVHRDIKPANLLVDREGNVKVLDMGLARFEIESENHELTDLTGTGMVMGTIDYMAPEQSLDTRTADARSDIYSLGCTFWYLLTGKSVYGGDTVMKKLLAHRDEEIPSLRKLSGKIPASVDDVFHKMVAKDKDDRYQSMQEVIDALQDCLQGKKSSDSRSDLSMAADPKLASFLKDIDVPKTTSPNMEYEESKSHTTAEDATIIGEVSEAPSSQKKQRPAFSTGKLPKWAYGIVAGVLALIVAALVIPGSDEAPDSKNANLAGNTPLANEVPVEPTVPVQLADVQWLPTERQESAADLLLSGEWEWRIEKNLGAMINSVESERSADISSDGKTLVFSRTPYSWNAQSLWISTRESVDSEWGLPVQLPQHINNRETLEHPILTPDASTILFTKKPTDSGTTQIFSTQRTGSPLNWATPQQFVLPNHSGPLGSIDISADGRTLIANTKTVQGNYDLIWAQRESTSQPWPSATLIGAPINSKGQEWTGTISNDRRMLIIQRGPDQGPNQEMIGPDLWMSLRASTNAPWSDPIPLETLNSPGRDTKPRLLADGKTLIFSSYQEGAGGGFDIWQARLVRKDSSLDLPPGVTADFSSAMTLEFEGRDRVKFPTFPTEYTGPFTVEGWFKPTQEFEDERGLIHLWGMIQRFPAEQSFSNLKSEPWLWFNAKDAIRQIQLTPFKEGQANHFAIIYDENRLDFYINGLKQGSRFVANIESLGHPVPSEFIMKNVWEKGLILGAEGRSEVVPNQMLELHVSNTVRYNEEFTPQKRFTPDENTVALYHFDQGAGSTLRDYSGNGYHGVIEGAEWVRVGEENSSNSTLPPGASEDYALSFQGEKDRVEIPTLLPPEGPITIELWARPRQREGIFLVLADENLSYNIWQGEETEGATRLTDATSTQDWRHTRFPQLFEENRDRWTHYAAVWDGEKIFFLCER